MARLLRKHLHFIIVVTLLTLVVTFPTILYVFRTDVIWLPTNDPDIYLHLWDAWYGKLVLTGQADRLYTNLLFYPQGLSLVRHPLGLPNVITTAALNIILPLSNAYNLAYLLIIISCALSAYVYLLWLFKDKWTALFGAVIFGFSPHVVGEPASSKHYILGDDTARSLLLSSWRSGETNCVGDSCGPSDGIYIPNNHVYVRNSLDHAWVLLMCFRHRKVERPSLLAVCFTVCRGRVGFKFLERLPFDKRPRGH